VAAGGLGAAAGGLRVVAGTGRGQAGLAAPLCFSWSLSLEGKER